MIPSASEYVHPALLHPATLGHGGLITRTLLSCCLPHGSEMRPGWQAWVGPGESGHPWPPPRRFLTTDGCICGLASMSINQDVETWRHGDMACHALRRAQPGRMTVESAPSLTAPEPQPPGTGDECAPSRECSSSPCLTPSTAAAQIGSLGAHRLLFLGCPSPIPLATPKTAIAVLFATS